MRKFKAHKRNEETFAPKPKYDSRKILPKLLKADSGILSKIQLSELSFFDLFQLIEEISQCIITNPEKNVFLFTKIDFIKKINKSLFLFSWFIYRHCFI